MTGRVGKADQALAVPATPANAVDGPSGFDPSRKEFQSPFVADAASELSAVLDCFQHLDQYVTNLVAENASLRDEVSRLRKEREEAGRVPQFEIAAKAIRDALGRQDEDWRQFVPAAFAALVESPAIATEAGTAETENTGSVHEGAGRNAALPENKVVNPYALGGGK